MGHMANWQERIKKSFQEEESRARQQRERMEEQLEEESRKKTQRESNELRIIAEGQIHNKEIAEMLGIKLEELGVKGRLEQILREVWRDGQIVQGSNVFSKDSNAESSQDRLADYGRVWSERDRQEEFHVSYLGLKYMYETTSMFYPSPVIHTSSMGEVYTSSGGSSYSYIATKSTLLVVACTFDDKSKKGYLQIIDPPSSLHNRDNFFRGSERYGEFKNSISLDEDRKMVIKFMEDQLLQNCVTSTKQGWLPADLKQKGRANIQRDIPFLQRVFRRRS